MLVRAGGRDDDGDRSEWPFFDAIHARVGGVVDAQLVVRLSRGWRRGRDLLLCLPHCLQRNGMRELVLAAAAHGGDQAERRIEELDELQVYATL
jgi:hypothetical protein